MTETFRIEWVADAHPEAQRIFTDYPLRIGDRIYTDKEHYHQVVKVNAENDYDVLRLHRNEPRLIRGQVMSINVRVQNLWHGNDVYQRRFVGKKSMITITINGAIITSKIWKNNKLVRQRDHLPYADIEWVKHNLYASWLNCYAHLE